MEQERLFFWIIMIIVVILVVWFILQNNNHHKEISLRKLKSSKKRPSERVEITSSAYVKLPENKRGPRRGIPTDGWNVRNEGILNDIQEIKRGNRRGTPIDGWNVRNNFDN